MAGGAKPLGGSQAAAWQANGHEKDVLFEGQYRRAKAKRGMPKHESRPVIGHGNCSALLFWAAISEIALKIICST